MCEVFILKFVCVRYPRNKVTDILICLLCIFVIILILQADKSILLSNAEYDDIVYGFIAENGWLVDESSLIISEIDFSFESDVIEAEYVLLQKSQGFYVNDYLDKRVVKFSYKLINYPGYLNEDGIYINVFLCEQKIIAADICSVRIDGFIRGAVVNENKVR